MTGVDLDDIKVNVKALALSAVKFGLPANRLLSDYRDCFGSDIPLAELGFRDVYEFIQSLSDIVYTEFRGNVMLIFAVVDSSTKHIAQLALKAKTKKLGAVAPTAVKSVKSVKSVSLSASASASNFAGGSNNGNPPSKPQWQPQLQWPSHQMETIRRNITRLLDSRSFPNGIKSQDLCTLYRQFYGEPISCKMFNCKNWVEVFSLDFFHQYFNVQKCNRQDVIIRQKAAVSSDRPIPGPRPPLQNSVKENQRPAPMTYQDSGVRERGTSSQVQAPTSDFRQLARLTSAIGTTHQETQGQVRLKDGNAMGPRLAAPIANSEADASRFVHRMTSGRNNSANSLLQLPPGRSQCSLNSSLRAPGNIAVEQQPLIDATNNRADDQQRGSFMNAEAAIRCDSGYSDEVAVATGPSHFYIAPDDRSVDSGFLGDVDWSLLQFIVRLSPSLSLDAICQIYENVTSCSLSSEACSEAVEQSAMKPIDGCDITKGMVLPIALVSATESYTTPLPPSLADVTLPYCSDSDIGLFQVSMLRYFSADNFILCLKKNEQNFEQLSRELAELFPDAMLPVSFEDTAEGLPCLCRSVLNGIAWCRAVIVSTVKVSDFVVKVYLVDYCFTVEVNLNRVFYLPRRFFSCPKNAIKARLALVKASSPTGWSNRAREVLENAFRQPVWAEVMDINQNDVLSVILTFTIDGKEYHVNDMLLSMDLAVPDVEYMSEKFLKTVGFSFDLSLNSQVRNGEKVTSSQEIIPQPLKDLEALLRNMGFNYENETEGHNLDIKCDKTFIRGILKDVEMAARNPGFPFSKVVPMISLLENKRNAMLEAGSRRACDNKNALFKISLIKEICTVLKRVLELKSRFAA